MAKETKDNPTEATAGTPPAPAQPKPDKTIREVQRKGGAMVSLKLSGSIGNTPFESYEASVDERVVGNPGLLRSHIEKFANKVVGAL